MVDFRRGIQAIEKAQESNRNQGGSFTPFAPNISWRQDKEEKYILFLNPAEAIPTVKMHEWIEVGTRQNGKPIYEWFISRKDPAVGEAYDDIEDRLGQPARERTVAVAVELEPTFEMIKGRRRPTGFEVKMDTFQRGEDEVVTPVLGLVIQSPLNFFGWVGSFNENTAPIEETPLRIERRGKDANTHYDFTAYLDQPVDFTNLFEYLDGVSYLADEDFGDLSELEGALKIGTTMLEKRLTELADTERYERLVSPIQELPDRFGKRTAVPTPAPEGNGAPEPSESRRKAFERLRSKAQEHST